MPKLPFLNLNQSGISQVVLLLLLAGAIVGGTYLVQQRTNILPFAADNNNINCEDARTGDEKACTRFTITSCVPESGKTCEVKFEWVLNKESDIDLRVHTESGETKYPRAKTDSGKTIPLPAGKYNAVISHANFGDDINDNNKDKLVFEVGNNNKLTYTWGDYKGSGSKNSNSSNNNASSSNSSTTSGTDRVPVIENGFFPTPPNSTKNDFRPYKEKQELLDGYLNGKYKGYLKCDTVSGDDKAKGTVLNAYKEDGTKDQYIIECTKNAYGSYKTDNEITCGKIKDGDKFAYGCVEKRSGSSSNNTSNNSATNNSTQSNTPPTQTEKQLTECGFSTTDGGVPLFAVQVGGKTSETEANCQQLIETQMKAFDERIKKAQSEANEAKARGETAKAEELQKKVDEANKKVADCQNKSSTDFANCAKEAQKVVQGTATAAQKQAISNALAKLEQIIRKERPGGCVKADLGITPFLEAQRLKRKPSKGSGDVENDEARRLLLCQGNKENNLAWRVLVGGATSDNSKDDQDSCGSGDCGNDAERIYGLHGTSPDATGAPNYPYTVEAKKNQFTIYDPNTADGVEKTIGKYIEAAKAGKTTMRGAPVEGDSETKSGSTPSSGSTQQSGTTQTSRGAIVSEEGGLVKYANGQTCRLASSCGNASGQGGRGDCCEGYSCQNTNNGKKCVRN